MREGNQNTEERNIRDLRQEQFADKYILTGCFGILDLCPRFGKIRTTFNIIKRKEYRKILIAYPDMKIEKSWKDEFELLGYDNPDIVYTTFLSLHKYEDQIYDFVIIDEIHKLSEAQMMHCRELIKNHKRKNILGLSGSIAPETEKDLWIGTGLSIVGSYSMQLGVSEGIISNYKIAVYQFPLDDVRRIFEDSKGRFITEKKRFDNVTWVINNLTYEGKDSMFMRLKRAQYLQSSPSKIQKAKQILDTLYEKRILVFTGSKKSCEALKIPYLHSSSKSEAAFERFAEGEGNHFAVVKIGNSGVTYKPLDTILISYFTSNPEDLLQRINRAMAVEYDNPEKQTNIVILCSNEKTEKDWLKKALYFVDSNKISYIEDSMKELEKFITN